MRLAGRIVLLLLATCTAGGASAQPVLGESWAHPARDSPEASITCGGGSVTVAQIAQFGARFDAPVRHGYSVYRHPELFSKVFAIRYRGRDIHVPAQDLVNFRRQLSRKQDWDFIHDALRNGRLGPGNTLGCFLDDGKIFFEADRQGRLTILYFNADLPWTWLRKPVRRRK